MAAVMAVFGLLMVMIVLMAEAASDTNSVYQPCQDSKVQRSDGFTLGIAISSRISFFHNRNFSDQQLSPCDSRLQLSSSNSKVVVFRPKVDEISLLTINSTASIFSESGGYMVAFAGRKQAARSYPTFIGNGTYTVTSFTLVLEFDKGVLQNLYWKRSGCSACSGKNSEFVCINNFDLDGRVNGAVEMCFGPFKRFTRYVNFSSPVIRERFNPKACAWGFGVNVFDLDAWRRDKCTEDYHKYLKLNKDSALWDIGKTLPVGLMTFYSNTKSLEKTWHVMGLGYNPSISLDEIANAAVIHFNGDMKPWLDVAMNQYKNLWMKYVDSEMEYLQLCNFGI